MEQPADLVLVVFLVIVLCLSLAGRRRSSSDVVLVVLVGFPSSRVCLWVEVLLRVIARVLWLVVARFTVLVLDVVLVCMSLDLSRLGGRGSSSSAVVVRGVVIVRVDGGVARDVRSRQRRAVVEALISLRRCAHPRRHLPCAVVVSCERVESSRVTS